MRLPRFVSTAELFVGLLLSTSAFAGGLEDDFMSTMFSLVPGTSIDYCAEAVPDLRAELATEAKRFDLQARSAATPFLQQLAAAGAEPLRPPEAQFAEVREKMLSEIRKAEPRSYCAGLLAKLRTVNPETLVAAAESQYRRLLLAAKAQSQQGPK